jgi:CO/xanthine dehydrogenase FAD-binding subunit
VPRELLAPGTEAAALAALGGRPAGEVAVLAGGTDLLLDLDDGRLAPHTLLSLRRLPWGRHDWADGRLRVGSTEPLADLETDPELAARLPALAQAIAAVGSRPLRRQATVGGNLARAAPASDLTPVLLALDAEVEIVGLGGARRLSVDRFLRASRETELAPGELIRSVTIPEARPRSAYLWQRVRLANDISQVGVAVAFSSSDRRWRVALGGAPPRPVLVADVAARLAGDSPSPADVAAAAERLTVHPGWVGDRRASDEHRRRLAGVLLRRAVGAAVGSPSEARA